MMQVWYKIVWVIASTFDNKSYSKQNVTVNLVNLVKKEDKIWECDLE